MARGFESKSVADQQESAQQQRPARSEPPTPARRRTLELARADLLRRLEGPGSPAYHEMLRRSLSAVDDELARVG